jgi:hypothetical protein
VSTAEVQGICDKGSRNTNVATLKAWSHWWRILMFPTSKPPNCPTCLRGTQSRERRENRRAAPHESGFAQTAWIPSFSEYGRALLHLSMAVPRFRAAPDECSVELRGSARLRCSVADLLAAWLAVGQARVRACLDSPARASYGCRNLCWNKCIPLSFVRIHVSSKSSIVSSISLVLYGLEKCNTTI